MPEYDAFGREIGETTTRPAPTPTPTPTAAPPEPEPDAARRTSGMTLDLSSSGIDVGRIIRIVIIVAVLAGAGSAFLQVKDVFDAFDNAVPKTPASPSAPPTAAAEPSAPEAPPARGLEGASLLRATTLTKALAGLRRRELGTITTLRVAADRVDAQLRTRDGRLRNVQIAQDGGFRSLSVSGPGFGDVPAIAWARIDPAAPQRLAAAAARRRHVSPARVDYLGLTRFGTTVRWNLFFADGTHVVGDEHGRNARESG